MSNHNIFNNNPLVLQRRGSSNDTDIYIFHPDATVENILSLRYTRIPQPKRFYIFLDGLNAHHVRALMEILQNFASRNILWKTFELRVANVGSYELVRNLMELSHALEMGENMVIHQGQIPPSIDGHQHRPFLLSSVMENKRMKHLSMDITLPRYSLGDIQVLGELLRTTTLEGVSLRLADGDNIEFLCGALAANMSLRQLQIDCHGVHTDDLLAAMLTSVQNHPTLAKLEIEAEEYGDLAFESIGGFLGSSTTLQELVIRCSSLDAPLKVVPLLRGLSHNESKLVKFHLEGFLTTTSLSAVFQAAARKPTMKQVALLLQDITANELTELQTMARLPHPVLLELPKDTVRSCEPTLCKMLLAHPELRFSDEHVRASSQTLRSICNLNYYGKYLLVLDRQKDVPLGIWPLVLQKAHEHPNVMYALLHGPAFCSRGS